MGSLNITPDSYSYVASVPGLPLLAMTCGKEEGLVKLVISLPCGPHNAGRNYGYIAFLRTSTQCHLHNQYFQEHHNTIPINLLSLPNLRGLGFSSPVVADGSSSPSSSSPPPGIIEESASQPAPIYSLKSGLTLKRAC